MTIKKENIDPFSGLINKLAQDMLEAKKLIPTLRIDCEIPISSINMELANVIESMQPFGEGNPAPIFCSRQVLIKTYPKIMGKDTLKFWVTDEQCTISAVGFGMAKYGGLIKPGAKIDLAYQITLDEWNKSPTPQLILKDIRSSE